MLLVSQPISQISLRFAIWLPFSRYTCSAFWDKCTEWPQNDLEPKRPKVPHISVTSIHASQISLISLYDQPFRDTGHLETQIAPNRHWSLQGEITVYIYMYNQCPWFPNFTQFHSTISRFRDTGNFETSALNNCKITLNTKRSYRPHIDVTSIQESQISLRFALRPDVFRILAILRQVHRMTPNLYWILKGQITLYMYSNFPRDSNFSRFYSTTSLIRVTGHFETGVPNYPQMSWTLQGQRYTTYVLLVSPSPKFHSVLLYNQPFSRYRTFYNSSLTTMLNGQKT